jgi:formyl-CoA transferase
VEKINPRIIYASVSGYGHTGPYSSLPGYDVVAQGLSGVMSLTGDPSGIPYKAGPSIADLIGAPIPFRVYYWLLLQDKTPVKDRG